MPVIHEHGHSQQCPPIRWICYVWNKALVSPEEASRWLIFLMCSLLRPQSHSLLQPLHWRTLSLEKSVLWPVGQEEFWTCIANHCVKPPSTRTTMLCKWAFENCFLWGHFVWEQRPKKRICINMWSLINGPGKYQELARTVFFWGLMEERFWNNLWKWAYQNWHGQFGSWWMITRRHP